MAIVSFLKRPHDGDLSGAERVARKRGVDLVVALYDGIIRFLYASIEAVERGDAEARRAAVKRALDIILHLQARLRMDVGGRPAQALSEYPDDAWDLIFLDAERPQYVSYWQDLFRVERVGR